MENLLSIFIQYFKCLPPMVHHLLLSVGTLNIDIGRLPFCFTFHERNCLKCAYFSKCSYYTRFQVPTLCEPVTAATSEVQIAAIFLLLLEWNKSVQRWSHICYLDVHMKFHEMLSTGSEVAREKKLHMSHYEIRKELTTTHSYLIFWLTPLARHLNIMCHP
jgi:hypothetical protein